MDGIEDKIAAGMRTLRDIVSRGFAPLIRILVPSKKKYKLSSAEGSNLMPRTCSQVGGLSRTAQSRSFNISVPEVHTLVLSAIAARAVCLASAAEAAPHPGR